MRLIDADTLIPKEVHTIVRLTETGEQTESVIYAEDIENAPTVDAVSVVRCKDCKHHDWCSIEDMALNDATFFCKWGERREADG